MIRRLVALLSEQANLEAQKEAALKQGQSASNEAIRQMKEAEVIHYCCAISRSCDQYCFRNYLEILTRMMIKEKRIKS